MTLVAIEALAVATILPLVSADLGDVALYGWTFSAFFLGTLVGIIVAGDLADHRGPALAYGVGLGLFAVGLAIGGAAPSMLVLVAGRLVQGLGAGAIPATSYSTIGRAFAERDRPRIFAMLSTAWVLPAIVGPVAAAFVANAFSWRVVFLGLLPFVALAGWLTLPILRRIGPPTEPSARRSPRDAFLVAAGAGCALAALSADQLGVALGLTVAAVLIGVPALRRVTPPGTYRARPGLPAAVLARGLLTFAFFGVDAFVPLMLTGVRGTSTLVGGLALTVSGVAWSTGSWIHERLAPRAPSRRFIGAGFALLTLGSLGMLGVLAGAVALPLVFVAWAIAGLGMGLAYPAISVLVLRLAPKGREGTTSAAMQVLDSLGTALGAGVGGAAIAITAGRLLPLGVGIGWSFAIAIAAGVVGLGVSRRLG